MKKITLKRNAKSGVWKMTREINGKTVAVEYYGAYATAINRAEYYRRMDWRYAIEVQR